ncbi:MAG: type 2 isopentenyl-diphosphate Delta-isomerase [Candidatus Thorarchaeota archaeon]|nr:MAG: type 2 isopentenyl-diphosphate Delta-isomerase [Candidatus Thorarchaeota archaeon]
MARGESYSSQKLGGTDATTKRRKLDHIEICLQEDVQSKASAMFDDIRLVHNALPEIDKDAIDLTTSLLGLKAGAPIVIAAMTGGHPDTYEVNRRLAEAAEELKLPIGVGSQRAAIEDTSLAYTFEVVREAAPSVPVIANIGSTHAEHAPEAVQMIDADILAVHLNPLQEAVQPEGECDSSGVLDKIASVLDLVDVPVIVKETGAGISSTVAKQLEAIGVDGVDVGGLGGTSWSAVEYYRALREKNHERAFLGHEYWDWGIPTALSLAMVVSSTDLSVIATGGIRTGLDVAKALSLGADAAGVAFPLLKPAVTGKTSDVVNELTKIIESLRVAMYLTGCQYVDDMLGRPVIIQGRLRENLETLGIDYWRYERKKARE